VEATRHGETVEGPLHAHEVGKREDSLSCRADSSLEGEGPCSPCRSRCVGGEQSDDEDEEVHYESAAPDYQTVHPMSVHCPQGCLYKNIMTSKNLFLVLNDLQSRLVLSQRSWEGRDPALLALPELIHSRLDEKLIMADH
jgi:hypothetical protein